MGVAQPGGTSAICASRSIAGLAVDHLATGRLEAFGRAAQQAVDWLLQEGEHAEAPG